MSDQDDNSQIRTRIVVGGTAEDDAAEFLDAWHRAERGEEVEPQRVLSFESWEALAAVMSGERLRLLRYVRHHPAPSVLALSKALGRQYRRVHADVSILAEAGLIDRSGGHVAAAVDRLTAEVAI